MRLLIINPNTTTAMTEKVVQAARAALPASVVITAATGRFGCQYISSRASFAVAGHAALDAYAEHGGGQDLVLLACFGDPGLEALREVSPAPVIGLVDAACAEAAVEGRRFAIVTGGERWGAMLAETILVRGLGEQLAAIRTVAPTGGDIARDPDGALALLADTCRSCIEKDGAQAVILGGVGLIGLAERIQPHFAEPIICSVKAGLNATIAALGAPRMAAKGTDKVASTGLSPALAAMFVNGQLI